MPDELEIAKLIYPKTWEEAQKYLLENPGTGSLLDHAKALNIFTKEIYLKALENGKRSPGTGTVWDHGMALMKYADKYEEALKAAQDNPGMGTVLDHAVMLSDFPEVYRRAFNECKAHPEKGDVRKCGLLILKAELDAGSQVGS
jgi:hypothetical protein